jgi:hypothetical protein
MTNWAAERGIQRSSIELGMLAERLIRVLTQIAALEEHVHETEQQSEVVEQKFDRKLIETGSPESEELDAEALSAQEAMIAARRALARLKQIADESRERLRIAGGYGAELSERGIEELKEWSAVLLGDSEVEKQCKDLLELQDDWILRVGKSSDFYAAMLSSAQIVAGTCIGMASVRGMATVAYDLCIVDEASKATATEILGPVFS